MALTLCQASGSAAGCEGLVVLHLCFRDQYVYPFKQCPPLSTGPGKDTNSQGSQASTETAKATVSRRARRSASAFASASAAVRPASSARACSAAPQFGPSDPLLERLRVGRQPSGYGTGVAPGHPDRWPSSHAQGDQVRVCPAAIEPCPGLGQVAPFRPPHDLRRERPVNAGRPVRSRRGSSRGRRRRQRSSTLIAFAAALLGGHVGGRPHD